MATPSTSWRRSAAAWCRPGWRGALPITYHVGGGDGARVHLAVKSDWSLKPLYDVVAVMKGSTLSRPVGHPRQSP